MAATYNLGAPPLWTDWYQGILLAGGTIEFFHSTDHSTHKDVYKTSDGSTAWDNPLTLDSYGRSEFPIYFKNDPDEDNYFIVVKNSSGAVDYTIDDYNGALTTVPSPATDTSEDLNYIRNPQFLVWDHEPVNYTSTIVTTYVSITEPEQIVDDWYFSKNVTSTTVDAFIRETFSPGQTDVTDGNPKYYLRYQCTATSGGELQKDLQQTFAQDVGFLQGETVLFSFWAKADIARTLNIYWIQNFGTTGSPSGTVTTNVAANIAIGTTWERHDVLLEIPSISGKSLGTDGNDYARISIRYDLNTACVYDTTNFLLQKSSVYRGYPENNYEGYVAQLSPRFQLPTGKVDFNFFSPAAVTAKMADLQGYLQMQDQTIGNPNSAATFKELAAFNLFVNLYETCADAQCPVSGGRTGNAVNDWNSSKTLTLPLSMGRSIGNSGAGSGLTSRLPGVSGGAETSTALIAHTHNYGGHLPVADGGYNATMPGAAAGADYNVPHANPGTTVATATATQSSGSGSSFSIMHPFSFMPAFIHL